MKDGTHFHSFFAFATANERINDETGRYKREQWPHADTNNNPNISRTNRQETRTPGINEQRSPPKTSASPPLPFSSGGRASVLSTRTSVLREIRSVCAGAERAQPTPVGEMAALSSQRQLEVMQLTVRGVPCLRKRKAFLGSGRLRELLERRSCPPSGTTPSRPGRRRRWTWKRPALRTCGFLCRNRLSA